MGWFAQILAKGVYVCVHDDVLGTYDKAWGGNGLLYHKDNTMSMHYHIRASIVGLLKHV